MPDPQTTNLGLYIPLNGADIGTWDVPMNANFNTLDNVLGASSTVTLSNVNVTLSPAQYGCGIITFSGTLTGNVAVAFPAVGRMYILQNNCTNNTTYAVFCLVSVSFNYVALPPNEPVAVMSDGSNMKFVGLGRVGSYLDFGGSSVPLWMSLSYPSPYLNCDGTAFSAVTYPALAAYLGGTTLPDARGRFRATLNQATGRLTAIDGNTLRADGGSQTITKANLPAYALTVTDPTHLHSISDPTHTHGVSDPTHNHAALNSINFSAYPGSGVGYAAGTDYYHDNYSVTQVAATSISVVGNYTGVGTVANVTGISVNSGGSGTGYAPPAYVGGLTLIRAG